MIKTNISVVAFTVLIMFVLLPLRAWAQDDVSSYTVGEKVEYKEGYSPREVWHQGTIVKILPEYKQVVIRWDPRPDYPSYTHNGVSSYEQGYGVDQVRHIKAGTAGKPANKNEATPATDGEHRVGDKVEFWNSAWYQGTIMEIGSDSYQGYYRVHWDKGAGNTSEWVSAKNIRAPRSNAPADTSHGPRVGKYIILSYGNPTNPIRIGYFMLSGSGYQYFSVTGKLLGSGRYSYDAGTSTVQWTSGPFKDAGFTGKFRIERDGKTHIIQLNTATVGSNSTDS